MAPSRGSISLHPAAEDDHPRAGWLRPVRIRALPISRFRSCRKRCECAVNDGQIVIAVQDQSPDPFAALSLERSARIALASRRSIRMMLQ